MKKFEATDTILRDKYIVKIDVAKDKSSVTFTDINNKQYLMYHMQDCCENVYLADIEGDLADITDVQLWLAEETTQRPETPEERDPEGDESQTWTFYRFGTPKGFVTMRWLGSSNGYYSETVIIEEVDP